MRTMYDAIVAANVPVEGDLYAGYIDGRWRSYFDLVARFPGKRVVKIAVFASTVGGEVYDVETGDLSPGQVPGVLQRERAAGGNPTIYCNLSNHQAIVDAVAAAGLAQPPYWIAHYTEVPHLEPGSVATQWHSGPGYDTSMVADYWPGIDPAPTPIPPPPPTTWEVDVQMTKAMITVTLDGAGRGWDVADGRDARHPSVPFDSLFSVFMNGADPTGSTGYVSVPVPSADSRGGFVQVEVIGGPPNGQIGVWVVYAS